MFSYDRFLFVQVTATQTGWARTETIINWLEEVLVPFVAGQPFMLILDQYPPHRSREVRDLIERVGGHLDFIPGKCTSLLQPLDISIMKAFKCRLRAIWKAWKVGNTDDDGQCPPITLHEVIRMISLAWERIDPNAVRVAFRASRLPLPVEGDDDEVDIENMVVAGNEEENDDGDLEFIEFEQEGFENE